MKHLMHTTIAAVLLVGCGKSQKASSPANLEVDIALLSAAYDGNIEEAKQQLANGADVNVKDKDYRNETPLQYAAQEGHKEVAELLIANGANVNAKVFGNGETPLQYAVQEGHKEIVELLIANGANVNALSVYGTPLDEAVERSESETADLLRKHGAKTSAELKAEGK